MSARGLAISGVCGLVILASACGQNAPTGPVSPTKPSVADPPAPPVDDLRLAMLARLYYDPFSVRELTQLFSDRPAAQPMVVLAHQLGTDLASRDVEGMDHDLEQLHQVCLQYLRRPDFSATDRPALDAVWLYVYQSQAMIRGTAQWVPNPLAVRG